MKQEIKDKWLSALRSGEYKQGTLQLRYENNYCCLGVLCDLYKKEHDDASWEADSFVENHFKFHDGSLCDNALITSSVMDWAGLTSNNPTILDDKALAQLNDAGKSFIEIADIIEKNL